MFPFVLYYFVCISKLHALLENKYPETWEMLGKGTLIKNNSLENSCKMMTFLYKKKYLKLNNEELSSIAGKCRLLLILGYTVTLLLFLLPITYAYILK